MSSDAKNKKRKKGRNWENYNAAFWAAMTVSSVIMAALGFATFGYSVMKLLFEGVTAAWGIAAAAGACAFTLAAFCLDLFPSWASVVRTIRLANARMEGAMSIAEINKYEEREDRRTNDVKDKVQEGYAKVGKDVLATQSKVDAIEQKLNTFFPSGSTSDIFKELRNDIAALNRKLDSSIESTNRSVRSLKAELDNIDKIKKKAVQDNDEDVPALDSDASDEEKEKTGGKKAAKRKSSSKKKKESKPETAPDEDGFIVEDDDLTQGGDYLDALDEFRIGAGWSSLIEDPYADAEPEPAAAADSNPAPIVPDTSPEPPAAATPEVVEEEAEDAEDGGTESYL